MLMLFAGMPAALWWLVVQGVMGAFDTLYYHEYRLRLPHQPYARRELRLHALRDAFYGVLFLTIGWVMWDGLFAWAFLLVIVAEIVVTLWDFVQEDRSRKLPHGERIGHALMGIVYGLFIAALAPELWTWGERPTGFTWVDHGPVAWLLGAMGIGVLGSGLRDLLAAQRKAV